MAEKMQIAKRGKMRKKKTKNSKERNEKVETKMKFRIDFQPPFLAKLINESRNQKVCIVERVCKRTESMWGVENIESVRD